MGSHVLVRNVISPAKDVSYAFLYNIPPNHDKMEVNIMIGGSMFQKLVREHPTLQEHWQTLLEKGFIENSKGCIALVRKYAADERVLIIRDAKNSILYTIRVGRLEVTRGVDTQNPAHYTFRVGESYDIVRIDYLEDTVHIATGNYFDDVLVCGRTMYEGIVAAKVENEENVYVFDICERRQKRES